MSDKHRGTCAREATVQLVEPPSHPRFNGSADTVWFSSTAASIGSDGRTSRTNLTADHQPEAREETGLEVLVDHLTAFTTAREPAKGFGVVNFVFSSRSV
jgi:hypothetical protein